MTGVALWLLVSFCFRFYLRYFDRYSMSYGSLGAVIILMLWFYLTGLVYIFGAAVNARRTSLTRSGTGSSTAR